MALAKTWLGCRPIAFTGQSDDVFADMINALERGEVDAVVDDEPAFGTLLEDARFRLAFTVNTANLWGAAMQKHQVELKSAIDGALRSLVTDDSLSQVWHQHLAHILYPKPCLV